MNHSVSFYMSSYRGQYRDRFFRIWRHTSLNQTSYQNSACISCVKDRMIFCAWLIVMIDRSGYRYLADDNDNTDYDRRYCCALDVITFASYFAQYYFIGGAFTQKPIE